MKPLIGLTVDGVPSHTLNSHPFYRVRRLYAEAVERAGGIPVLLPWSLASVPAYAAQLHGLVIVGGDDIDPKLYGEQEVHPSVCLMCKERTDFEWAMLDAMFQQDKPVLGICGGMQLLNVWAGGSLYQDISLKHGCDVHEHGRGRFFSHRMRVDMESWLYSVAPSEHVWVNSFHHQIVREVAPSFQAVAWSDDGVIEAIESISAPLMLGVQWHPEYGEPSNELWWKAWVESCVKRQAEGG